MNNDGYVKIITIKDVYMPGVYRANLEFYTKNRILYYKNPADGKMRHLDESIYNNLLSRITSKEDLSNDEKMMRLSGLFKISEYYKSKFSPYLCDHDQMDHHTHTHNLDVRVDDKHDSPRLYRTSVSPQYTQH